MGWLEKLTFGKGGGAVAVAEREDADSSHGKSGPPLMVLVSDASGRASFKTHVFDNAESATEWVRYWFPLESEDGLTAFWAMTEQPEGGFDGDVEAVVMIRDTSRDGVVYLFSFVDIDSAQIFLREEVERGAKLDTMLLYWAVQVKRELDRCGMLTLTPSTPPGVAAYAPAGEAPESDGWVVQDAAVTEERAPAKPMGDARALTKEAPNAHTGVAEPNGPGLETFELTSWMERARQKPSSELDAVRAAAEVVAARKNELRRRMRNLAPETAQDEAAVVDEALEAYESEPFIEAAPVVEASVEAPEPEVVVEAVVVGEEAPQVPQPEAVIEPVLVVEAPEAIEQEVAVEAPAVEKASEDTEDHELREATSHAEGAEVDDRGLRVRASTNGNGHKPAHNAEVVVEINGHKTTHDSPAELGDLGSPAVDERQLPVQEETLRSFNGNAAANGHSAKVTGPNGEGTPAVGRSVDRSDAGGAAEAPEVVHDVRIEAATNGRVDETISIQIGIHLQSKALKMKRWEVKDTPFEGFKSPPGKF